MGNRDFIDDLEPDYVVEEDLVKYAYQPTYILGSVGDIVKERLAIKG